MKKGIHSRKTILTRFHDWLNSESICGTLMASNQRSRMAVMEQSQVRLDSR